MLVLSLLSGSAVPIRAQDGGLRRPRLPAAADTNDWQVYFDFAAANLPARPTVADAGFYWAGRLAPERAEPLVGRWVAFWLRNLSDFEYRGTKREPPDAAKVDSMRWRSRWRNPLMPPTLEVLVYDRLPGRWGDSPLTRGLLAYAAGRHEQAAELWERAIRSDQRRNMWLRYHRAGLLAQLQRWDEAVSELDTLAALLQHRDTTARSSPVYEQRESVYHALGMLHLARNDGGAARQALERALIENLGYAPAHATLGEVALASRNAAGAVTELAQAVDLAPDDVWFRHRLGVALIAARQGDSAIAVLSDVNRREPFFAAAYFDLGRAKEQRADPAGARAAYQGYLARAPRREIERIQLAEQRLAALPP